MFPTLIRPVLTFKIDQVLCSVYTFVFPLLIKQLISTFYCQNGKFSPSLKALPRICLLLATLLRDGCFICCLTALNTFIATESLDIPFVSFMDQYFILEYRMEGGGAVAIFWIGEKLQ